ncbi:UDP-2,3-diacylglucosamine diphosphatase [Porticoccus litoralis]|uniref:UDP-2,3-diacylglucosamine hydrolase n=1 Tax=Porticoccus litoralis TaxID=434086 RepID=A0AAW8B188_9GAMM|nr:UDP-2,3-diacylglucosamine diphosphatase [Porticoccus litoralis]MDP1519820.1 UDP-2,3-diacylglucosamine diphosphatase [Porticoccus litoralis]
MSTLLISDLHLSPERPAVTRAFFAFLHDKAREAEALYILGDLFESWIGDDDPAPLPREVIGELKQLSDSGTLLYFMHGNRDFMIARRFARETGCTLLPDHYVARLAGEPVLLMHGDTLCTDDVDYQKFRRISRFRPLQFVMRHLPLKKRQKIAADLRRKSMSANANKADNIMDVSPVEVERMMRAYDVKRLIHGHTHRPDRHRLPCGERLVLGDWHHHGWYIEIEKDREPELISFPIED